MWGEEAAMVTTVTATPDKLPDAVWPIDQKSRLLRKYIGAF